MAKILNTESVRLLGVGATVPADIKRRFRYSYTEDGVTKRMVGTVDLATGDTKAQAKTKAIAQANADLGL